MKRKQFFETFVKNRIFVKNGKFVKNGNFAKKWKFCQKNGKFPITNRNIFTNKFFAPKYNKFEKNIVTFFGRSFFAKNQNYNKLIIKLNMRFELNHKM